MAEDIQSPQGLIACPFCGGKPHVEVRGGAAGVCCKGEKGEHLIWAYGATEAEAISAWNTRSAPPGMVLTAQEAGAAFMRAEGFSGGFDCEGLVNVIRQALAASPSVKGEGQ